MINQTPDQFEAKRISTALTTKIKGDADAIFKLACPVEELKWIDNWQFEMIFSSSGKNENNCIFKETMSGLFVLNSPETDTYWYTTLYDKKTHQFHSLLMFGDFAAGKFEFNVKKDAGEYTAAHWRLTYTALNEKGNTLADASLADRLAGMLNFLSESAKHYIETGNMLKIG
jgi:hypothetical protein